MTTQAPLGDKIDREFQSRHLQDMIEAVRDWQDGLRRARTLLIRELTSVQMKIDFSEQTDFREVYEYMMNNQEKEQN